MARIYATQDAYNTWTGTTGTTISDGLLRAASLIVDEALIGATYATHPDTGLPTDTKIAATLSDATCAQAQYMDATGDTSGVGDVMEVDSASIGSVSYSGRHTMTSKLPSGRTLSGTAAALLHVEGLLPVRVQSRG